MEANITEFEIKVAAINEDDNTFWFHDLRSIAKSQQKILQRPCGVAGDFSSWIITNRSL